MQNLDDDANESYNGNMSSSILFNENTSPGEEGLMNNLEMSQKLPSEND